MYVQARNLIVFVACERKTRVLCSSDRIGGKCRRQPLQQAQAAGCRRWRALLGSKPLAHGPAPSTRLCDGWSERLSSADVCSLCSSISRGCSALTLQEHQRRPSSPHVAETVCAAHVRRLKDLTCLQTNRTSEEPSAVYRSKPVSFPSVSLWREIS